MRKLKHRWMLYAAVACVLAALCAGCAGDRYRIIDGPATFRLGEGRFTPALDVELEDGSRAYFGPTPPENDARNGQIDPNRSGSRAQEAIEE